MLKISRFDVAALRALAHGLETDPARAAGRSALRRFTDPNSVLRRLWARAMSGDSQIYNVNDAMQKHLANPHAGGMVNVQKALAELGHTATRRQQNVNTVGKVGLLGAGGLAGAKLLGEPFGRKSERQRLGENVESQLPSMPLSSRLGAALKTVFTPSSMGRSINSAMNQEQ